MPPIRILSWNVNGLRAIHKKGFLEWLLKDSPDILCIQETKAHPEQLPKDLNNLPGYHTYYCSAEKKGYSGVAVYSKEKPLHVSPGFGKKEFDREGRTLAVDYGNFLLFNVYFPNGKASEERLCYKMDFYDAFLQHMDDLRNQGQKIIICGDVNTAHNEIDLARPNENKKVSGFLPEERAWIDTLLAHGFIDTFRFLNQEAVQYSWWDYKTRARERNIGWRIDYFFVSKNLESSLKSGFILSDVMGSDHCPIGIALDAF
jgi:exodeoxyribonuclease-3